MTAPRFTLLETERFEWPFTLRLPFRFGVITVTQGRQAVIRARIRLEDGREAWGIAAETLAAKWFDKDPKLSDAQNEQQLRRALLDRAMLDAVLKAQGLSFWAGMRANIGGMAPHAVIPDLAGFDFAALLESLVPLRQIHARHTVGLVDPITAADQDNRVEDGLPETLEEILAVYRHRYWKLKVGGNIAQDVDRLCRIAAVLDRMHGGYHASLDGNEQYEDAEGAAALWRAMQAEPRLRNLCASILYIEQPVKRAGALETGMAALAAQRPVIIDESDGPLDAFVTGRALGYAGVSSKACKGVWRSVINLARCRAWNVEEGSQRYFMSAEDLTTLAGVCVQQDLALVSLLGLPHVERNGHHFVDGFAGRPKAEAYRFLEAHGSLYADTARGPRLAIREGSLDLSSLDTPGLGATIEPDTSAMDVMAKAVWV